MQADLQVRDGAALALVLVHGAGHTSRVWDQVRAHLAHASVAVDVPGRRDRPADVTRVTIDEAADSLAADVRSAVEGPVVIVGHSTGGILVPGLAARLGDRVTHLVFVAGLCAREGEKVVDTVLPGEEASVLERLAGMRRQYRGAMVAPEPPGSAPTIDDEQLAMPDRVVELHDADGVVARGLSDAPAYVGALPARSDPTT